MVATRADMAPEDKTHLLRRDTAMTGDIMGVTTDVIADLLLLHRTCHPLGIRIVEDHPYLLADRLMLTTATRGGTIERQLLAEVGVQMVSPGLAHLVANSLSCSK